MFSDELIGKNYFVLFQIRGGKLISQEKFISEGGESPAEVMGSFLRDYYSRAADVPKEVIISIEVNEKKVMTDYISSHKPVLVHSMGLKAAGFSPCMFLWYCSLSQRRYRSDLCH